MLEKFKSEHYDRIVHYIIHDKKLSACLYLNKVTKIPNTETLQRPNLFQKHTNKSTHTSSCVSYDLHPSDQLSTTYAA